MKIHLMVFAMFTIAPLFATEPFVAHEWGTFTSVANATDGLPVEWAPIGGSPELPCFVERLKLAPTKYSPAYIRMETPVLFFYAKQAMTLSVVAQFPKGLMTDWYPRATKVAPENPKMYDLRDGSLAWNDVKVLPGTTPELPATQGKSQYYAARNTDAAPLEVGNQTEKMLFYRGVANYYVPMSAKYREDGKIELHNSSDRTIPLAILFENHGGKVGYRVIGPVKEAVTIDAPEMNGDLDALRNDLIGRLVEFGLYKKEAQAMIETWRDSWFEEGTRVLQIVPRAQVDEWVPLQITPAPEALTRVYVGRIEILSPGTRATLMNAILHQDAATLQKFGRFLGPFIDQMGMRSSSVNQIIAKLRGDPAACVQ